MNSRAAFDKFEQRRSQTAQNPRRANATQLRDKIEQATTVIEANVATAQIGCMTKPHLKLQLHSDSRQQSLKVKLEKSG